MSGGPSRTAWPHRPDLQDSRTPDRPGAVGETPPNRVSTFIPHRGGTSVHCCDNRLLACSITPTKYLLYARVRKTGEHLPGCDSLPPEGLLVVARRLCCSCRCQDVSPNILRCIWVGAVASLPEQTGGFTACCCVWCAPTFSVRGCGLWVALSRGGGASGLHSCLDMEVCRGFTHLVGGRGKAVGCRGKGVVKSTKVWSNHVQRICPRDCQKLTWFLCVGMVATRDKVATLRLCDVGGNSNSSYMIGT